MQFTRLTTLIITICLAAVNCVQAQSDTLFYENFEPPSGPDKVVTLGLNGASQTWNDTTNLSVSGSASYHGQVERGALYEVVFRTDTFSTKGLNANFVTLKWNQIAKLLVSNRAILRLSDDAGQSWVQIDRANSFYHGNSVNFDQLGWFNESSYTNSSRGLDLWKSGSAVPAQASWWTEELLDISSLALGAGNSGKDSLMLEFACQFVTAPSALREGWYVDDLIIKADSCEPFKPRLSTDFFFDAGCRPNPTGIYQPDSNGRYELRVFASDSVPRQLPNDPRYSGIDSVFLFYRITDSLGNTTSWRRDTMESLQNGKYKEILTGINSGDTVEYYYFARDKGCETARLPEETGEYYSFNVRDSLSPKCGSATCNNAPQLIENFPWKEDFEGTEWVPGSGNGNSGIQHRGRFPNTKFGKNQFWTVAPTVSSMGYGWSIRQGATATSGTGPSGNNTAGGNKYIYAEASQGKRLDFTSLITPCISLANDSQTKLFEFYYHFYGEHIGNLRIDIDTGSIVSTYLLNYKRIKGEQQSSSNSPWKRAILDLTPFSGKVIKVRFASVKLNKSSEEKGDMAIDDFRIYEPAGGDAEVVSIESPSLENCTYSNSEKVSVILQNGGKDTLTSLPIVLRLTGPGGTNTQTETANLNLAPGDTTLYQLQNTASLSSAGSYTMEVFTTLSGDIDRSNDSASVDINSYNAISSFPVIEDFDNAGAAGTQSFGSSLFRASSYPGSSAKWYVAEKHTSNPNFGPLKGYHDGGKYTLLKSENIRVGTAYLESKQCFDLSGLSDPAITFFYHYDASLVNSVFMEVLDNGEWKRLTAGSQGYVNSNAGDPWTIKNVSLSNYKGRSVKIRFGVKKRIGTTSPLVALDKIMIYDRIASDIGIYNITRPNTGILANFSLNQVGVRFEAANFGTAAANNITLEISVTPLCGPNKGVTNIYTDSSPFSIGAFQDVNITSFTIPVEIEKGACRVCAYPENFSGDTNNFNDTVCRVVVGRSTVRPPFIDNFDTCQYDRYGFFANGDLLQWERTTPSGTTISSAQSSPNAWVLADTGAFIGNSEESLNVPNLDGLDSVSGAQVRFWQNVDMGSNAAGSFENRDLNNGVTSVGNSVVNTNNWYGSSFGTFSSPLLSGRAGFTGNSNGWKFSYADLDKQYLDGTVQVFRFHFDSQSLANNTGNEGWAIDDFEYYIPPQHSASPANLQWKLAIPLAGTNSFDLRIKNTGAIFLQSAVVTVLVNGSTAATDSLVFAQSGLRPGSSQVVPFSSPVNLQAGNNTVTIITSRPNAMKDDKPFDDTLQLSLTAQSPLDTNLCTQLEQGPFFSPRVFGQTATNLWQYGTPQKSNISGANSGSNAWVTNLRNNYPILREESILTPTFVVEKGKCYRLEFMHNFSTEANFDGGNVEFQSLNNSNWSLLGAHNASDSLWYNSPAVQALDQSRAGWSGQSNGWVPARYDFQAFEDDTLIFRFNFASNGSINGEGWAIDDFCFKELSSCDSSTSLRESTLAGLSVFPNPARDYVTVKLPAHRQNAGIKLIDATGRTVIRRKADEALERLDLRTLSSGVYLLRITSEGWAESRRIVVQ